MRLFLIFICCVTINVSCVAQKKILKAARKLEASGLYQDASEKYMDALYRNNTNLDSREGLRRTSQKVLDDMLSDYFQARNKGELQKAIKYYEDARFYQERISYFRVELNIPDYYEKDYNEDKENLLDGWYNEAITAFEDGHFDKAKSLYSKILSIDPEYKDVIDRRDATSTEPYYRRGIDAYEKQNYGQAWKEFQHIKSNDPNYNSAKSYQQNIIDELSISMSVLPAQTNFHKSEWKLRSNIVAQISKLKSPFIKLVDRENLDQIIEEQKLGLTGFVNEKTAARVGQIIGAKSVLITKVVNYNYSPGQMIRNEKVAYSGGSIYSSNSNFRPVKYNEFSQVSTMQVSVQYQLISSETSEVLAADVIHEEINDEMIYATYRGDYNKLFPAKGDLVYKTGKERADFLELFSAKREVASQEDLDFRIQNEVATKLAGSLNAFLVEKY